LSYKTIPHTLLSAATSLGINAIPVGVVFAWGRSMQTGMVLYFLETLVSIFLTIAFVLLRAPAEDPGYAAVASSRTVVVTNGRTVGRTQAGNRRSLIEGFLIFSVGFGVIPGFFLAFWMFVVAHVNLAWSAVASGLAGIAVFQLINLIGDFLMFRRLTPEGAGSLINQSMGRVAIIYISVFVGLIVAMVFSIDWFILPFAVLKTLADMSFLFRRNSAIQAQAVA
jgi:hypothetical protein